MSPGGSSRGRVGLRRRSALLAGIVIAAVPLVARAQAPEPGRAYGLAFQPLPAGAAFAVRALDDSAGNLRLARRFAEALRHRGRAVQPALAPLTLNFETEIQQVPNRDTRYPGDSRGPVRYVLTATVDDATGKRLWNGEASYVGNPNAETLIFAQLVEVLADEVGRTSAAHGFLLE